MNLRFVLHLLVLSSGLAAAARGPAPAPQAEEPLRYGRIGADAVSIRNLADEKGREVAQPARGELVAVHGETRTGWLEVEVPGGFAVWVFGRYLTPTDEPGVYEVTGNAVNLRPAPSSDVTNFPLPQRLQSGMRVRGMEVAEADKPLAETWMRIWSPPGVRGYVQAASVTALPAGEDGAAAWKRALAALPSVPIPQVGKPAEAAPAEDKVESAARQALDEARSAMEREKIKETPDYAPIEAALNGVVERGGTVAIEARAELRTLATLREAAALKADLERERVRRQEEAARRQREVWERSREKDPLGSVFTVRGVVERRTDMDGVARFYVRFGGVTTSELVCSSGRYDLTAYAGTEIGVLGSEVGSRTGEVPTFEVNRIEVLASR
jgi:hypothetical protein